MFWWEIVCRDTNADDTLFTPGRGLDGGKKKKPFKIVSKDPNTIVVKSGRSYIPLDKGCFDVIEKTFNHNPCASLRVASLRENEPIPGSADELIRRETGSNLARANYVCSILEHCKLVRYAMVNNRKVIQLNLQTK